MVDSETGEILSETKRLRYVADIKPQMHERIDKWVSSFMRGLDSGRSVNLVVTGTVLQPIADIFSDTLPFLPNNEPCPF